MIETRAGNSSFRFSVWIVETISFTELIILFTDLSRAQRTLSNSLQNFNFECIGTSQTDDEVVISKSLAHFGRLIASIEDERDRMVRNSLFQADRQVSKLREYYMAYSHMFEVSKSQVRFARLLQQGKTLVEKKYPKKRAFSNTSIRSTAKLNPRSR